METCLFIHYTLTEYLYTKGNLLDLSICPLEVFELCLTNFQWILSLQ